MAEFQIPSFLQNRSVDDFHSKMKTELPVDIDTSEGSHTWNMSRPTALVAAELCEFILPEVIKLILPEFSYGTYLDGHAKLRGMSRRPAAYSSGYITVTGEPESIIPEYSKFSTASVNDEPSVEYMTMENAVIPAGGSIKIPVECVKPGTVGNTAKNTIIMLSDRLTGIDGVTNEEEIMGGTEVEDDETLKERILEYDRSQGESFTGCPADYKRWAMSVEGVGEAAVISAQDTSGLVTIVVTDANGDPATDELCQDVYDYIMIPEDPDSRRAPVNAFLSVIPPAEIPIVIEAVIELKENGTMEAVSEEFLKKCTEYLPRAMDAGEVKRSQIAKLLASLEYANDFSDLQIGIVSDTGTVEFSTNNVPITNRQLPRVYAENLIFTAGVVE